MDKAEPEDQTIHRHIRKYSQNPDHHRHDRLPAAGYGKKDPADKSVIATAYQIGLGQPHAEKKYPRIAG